MFRRKTQPVVDGDISVDALRNIVQSLDERQPITDEYEARTASRGRYANSKQKAHLDGWLSEYDGPGAYSRKNPSTSGKTFYNHFRCAPGLLWLAEALGEDPMVLREAVAAIDAAGHNPSSECAAFRRAVPWSRIIALVEAQP